MRQLFAIDAINATTSRVGRACEVAQHAGKCSYTQIGLTRTHGQTRANTLDT